MRFSMMPYDFPLHKVDPRSAPPPSIRGCFGGLADAKERRSYHALNREIVATATL
jgi:hypothetical protein